MRRGADGDGDGVRPPEQGHFFWLTNAVGPRDRADDVIFLRVTDCIIDNGEQFSETYPAGVNAAGCLGIVDYATHDAEGKKRKDPKAEELRVILQRQSALRGQRAGIAGRPLATEETQQCV